MKHYTSIEQSKKLLELGLSPESADMFWRNAKRPNYIQCFVPAIIHEWCLDIDLDVDIPCWSVGSLLEVMPDVIDDTFKLKCIKDNIVAGYYFCYHDKNDKCNKTVFASKIPINAAYNMVVWLIENGYIKTNK